MPQFGDNDGGRFLKLEPDEPAGLDHRYLLAALNGLVGREDWNAWTGPRLEETMVRAALGGNPRRVSGPVFEIRGSGMGLYKLAQNGFHVVLRCGEAGQRGNGGHAHADLQSFELSIGGRRFVVDPGTYVYTPIPKERNHFRSCGSHNAYHPVGREPVTWRPGPEGLFSMSHWPSSSVEVEAARRLAAHHKGFGVPSHRLLALEGGRLDGEDHLDLPEAKCLRFCLHSGVRVTAQGRRFLLEHEGVRLRFESPVEGWALEEGRYSPTYGVWEPTLTLALTSKEPVVRWSFVVEAGL